MCTRQWPLVRWYTDRCRTRRQVHHRTRARMPKTTRSLHPHKLKQSKGRLACMHNRRPAIETEGPKLTRPHNVMPNANPFGTQNPGGPTGPPLSRTRVTTCMHTSMALPHPPDPSAAANPAPTSARTEGRTHTGQDHTARCGRAMVHRAADGRAPVSVAHTPDNSPPPGACRSPTAPRESAGAATRANTHANARQWGPACICRSVTPHVL